MHFFHIDREIGMCSTESVAKNTNKMIKFLLEFIQYISPNYIHSMQREEFNTDEKNRAKNESTFFSSEKEMDTENQLR